MLGQMAPVTSSYADNDNAAFGAWCETWLTRCLRVLKPGGHLLAFGVSHLAPARVCQVSRTQASRSATSPRGCTGPVSRSRWT